MTNFVSDTKLYPLMPLRDIVVFPHMVAPLVVGRKQSIQALEDAMEKRTEIFLVTQINAAEDEPGPDGIHRVGTLANVMQLLRLPDGTIKALVEGKRRAQIVSFVPHDRFMQAELREFVEEDTISREVMAYERELRKYFEQYSSINNKIAKEVVKSIHNIDNPRKLVDVICAHLPLKAEEKQEILEYVSLDERIEKILETLIREIELSELEREINARVKARMSKTQRNYYLGEKVKRSRAKWIREKTASMISPRLEEAITKKKLPKLAREKVTKELKKLKCMPPMSAETTVVRNYIDTILSLPWKKKSKSVIDINKAETILEEDHYGLQKPKERILEYLAVQAQVKKIKGPILCLVGPPGCGQNFHLPVDCPGDEPEIRPPLARRGA